MPDSKRPVLAVVAGPNGSGKTTITETLLKHKWLQGCEYINPDNLAQELGDWNDPKLSLMAARISQQRREELLKNRESIAFETVFSSPEKLEFIQKAQQAGYFVRLFFVSTECPSINAARITKRFLQGGHAVPIEKIVDRYYKSIQQCVDAVGLVERLDVFDNSQQGAGEWTRLLKLGPDEKLKMFVPSEQLPEWSHEIYREASARAVGLSR